MSDDVTATVTGSAQHRDLYRINDFGTAAIYKLLASEQCFEIVGLRPTDTARLTVSIYIAGGIERGGVVHVEMPAWMLEAVA